jgi:hypothetical protein
MRDRWLLKAISYCGSPKQRAARMGMKPEKLSHWLNYARKISLRSALLIEKATNKTIDHRYFFRPNQPEVTKHFKEVFLKKTETKNLNISERAMIGLVYEQTLERNKRTKKYFKNSEKFPTKLIRREALAAEYAHFSNYRTFRDAKYVTQRGSPELIQAMDRECISISTAAQLLRYSSQEQQQLLTHNHKEIITYTRQFNKKTHSLPSTRLWVLIVHVRRIHHKKEIIHG